ncbi:AGAP001806-PA-like protein [Anopheles sinensis]|uniref:AGAP001806-PA-like protein n=1 Tax=Anopheles sinensis TaxID=74873 RepID=A0A084VAI9_ANOSI|nr:AGAP001806-PA-like protein [Anopheles sinensis]
MPAMMSHRMSPKTRVVFKFIFGLGIWSFLVLGFFKLNGDQVMQHQFHQTPINGRLLLNKDNRWTGNEATSTTTDRYLSPAAMAGAMAGVDEVLVDNRAGKKMGKDGKIPNSPKTHLPASYSKVLTARGGV